MVMYLTTENLAATDRQVLSTGFVLLLKIYGNITVKNKFFV
jgi:hypothetical protein